MEHALPVLQIMMKSYTRAPDYQNYQLANCSLRYDDKGSSYITNLVKKEKLQMKAHLFALKAILTIGFFATFKRTPDTNKIHEKALMCVLPHHVKNTSKNA